MVGAVIEADYLVVGAGASGMAFTDSLLANGEANVVLVDCRDRPGGHWRDAYPFVRLHLPSANYGVNSRPLGENRIDERGSNAGCYERASADEICAYYSRVLEDDFVGGGRVRFLGMSEYRGYDQDGHHVESLLTGRHTLVRATKVVDATYVAAEVPSRRPPRYDVDREVVLVTPNQLPDLAAPPAGFTVIGGGKTAMDTCLWLIDGGVDPGRIRWIRPRDSWLFNRSCMQPLALVASVLRMQASWLEAAAVAVDGADFACRLEADEVFVRLDTATAPTMFRGATVSAQEADKLRTIDQVVRTAKVRRISGGHVLLDRHAVIPSSPGEIFIDCTAAGVPSPPLRPVFESGRITVQGVAVGMVPWSAATIGLIEATRDSDEDKNRLCPPLTFTGDIGDVLDLAHIGLVGTLARAAQPDIAAWTDACRLNPAAGAMKRADDPGVAAAITAISTNIGPALGNLKAVATQQK